MTDNEIIKALECCKKAILHQDCLDLKCPFVREFGCNFDKEQLRNMALDLINRLKAENDDLFYKLQGVMLSVDKWLEGVELEQDEVNRAATMREKTLCITEQQQLKINGLESTVFVLETDLDKAEGLSEALGNDVDIKLKYIYDLEERLNKYQHIESTISEFWTGLEKLSMFKGKEKPTLEELLEYIEQKDEEIRRLQKDKADIISAVEYRINQAKESAYKEFVERLKERSIDIDVSYGYGKEHHTEAVTVIEIDNLLAELTPEPLTKIDHSSLCETETYEGK